MRRIAQAPSYYEVELRQPPSGEGGTDTAWRPARLVRPRTFATLDAAQAQCPATLFPRAAYYYKFWWSRGVLAR